MSFSAIILKNGTIEVSDLGLALVVVQVEVRSKDQSEIRSFQT